MKTGNFFEINISNNGKHVFATDSMIRSYPVEKIKELLALLVEKFPVDSGYEFSVTCWKCSAGIVPEEIVQLMPKR